MNPPAINLVVALPPEAKPVNQHLGLLRDNHHDQYRLYHHGRISLVISGPGTDAAAAATNWLHGINGHRQDDIWINLGIAGHPDHQVGQIFLASRIEDMRNGHVWPLQPREDLPCPSEQLVTVTQPDTGYGMDALLEMEAAGFYCSALKHTTPDNIYCLKVVSDNRKQPAHMLNGKMVSQLIRKRLDVLDLLIKKTESNEEHQ